MNEHEDKPEALDTIDYKRAYESAMEALRIAQEALVEAQRAKRQDFWYHHWTWPASTNPQPYRCPVCNGSGKEHDPCGGVLPGGSCSPPNPCHACGGRGIVWSQP